MTPRASSARGQRNKARFEAMRAREAEAKWQDSASHPWPEFSISDHRLLRVEPGCFVSDASELGFAPGQWPDNIVIVLANGERHEIGNEAGAFHNRDGELERVEYRSRRMLLTVWND